MNFTEEMLDKLRIEVGEGLSEKRYNHILEVEKMVARLAALYCPEKTQMLRAAALLHDITKEWQYDEQINFLKAHGESITESDFYAPKTFHARSAALLISEKYTDFADSEVISCVRWHTVGHAEMTLAEKLVYLADYIDMSRKFQDCVALRNMFWDAEPEKMTQAERLIHLDRTMLKSYDLTVAGLIEEGLPICPDTCLSRNAIVCQLKKNN